MGSLLYAILPKLMLGVEDNLQCAIVLVILPLVSLMKDQVANLKKNTAWSLFSSERSMTAYGITLRRPNNFVYRSLVIRYTQCVYRCRSLQMIK